MLNQKKKPKKVVFSFLSSSGYELARITEDIDNREERAILSRARIIFDNYGNRTAPTLIDDSFIRFQNNLAKLRIIYVY